MSLDRVAGVDDPGEMRIVPGAPPSVVGLTEWRGRVVTVLDLAILTGTAAFSRSQPERSVSDQWSSRGLWFHCHCGPSVDESNSSSVCGAVTEKPWTGIRA